MRTEVEYAEESHLAEVVGIQKVRRVYRASQANLFSVCPAASFSDQDEVIVNPVDDAGTLGTAVHEACACIVLGGTPDLDVIQQKYSLDRNQRRDLDFMVGVASRFIAKFKSQFPSPVVEQELRVGNHSGHVDFAALDGDVVRVGDFKTTRLPDANYRAQMMMYLYLLSKNPQVFRTVE